MTVKYLKLFRYRFLSTKTWNCSTFYRISSLTGLKIKLACGVYMTSLLFMYAAAVSNALFIIKMAELSAYRDQHFRVM